jgi:hypothetical protein
MEIDRFKQNGPLYIFSVVFLVLSIGLFAFSLFTAPYLLFDARYDVPEFISYWVYSLQIGSEYSERYAKTIIFLFFVVLSGIFGILAYLFSNRIEDKLYHEDEHVSSKRKLRMRNEQREAYQFLLKVILVVILVFIGVAIFQLLIYIPPPSEHL